MFINPYIVLSVFKIPYLSKIVSDNDKNINTNKNAFLQRTQDPTEHLFKSNIIKK